MRNLNKANTRLHQQSSLYSGEREAYREDSSFLSSEKTQRSMRLPPARNAQLVPLARQLLQPQLLMRFHTQIQHPSVVSVEPSTTSREVNSHPLPSVCPICKGAGFLRCNVALGHPQFGKPLACQCQEQKRQRKRRQQLWELSNLGNFADKRFETFFPHRADVKEVLHGAITFAQNPGGWLLLVGPSGCGKTHLAAAIANACLEAGAVVLFSTVPDLLDHLRATFAPSSKERYSTLFTRMREADLLVLDDLGSQQSSSWANEKLFQLVNHRYNARSPTVITTSPKDLQGRDERLRSRLSDRGLVTLLDLTHAGDYRPSRTRLSMSNG